MKLSPGDRPEVGATGGGERLAAGKNWLVLGGLWAVFYGSFTLFRPPLLDDADSVHAEVAREMLLRHDWVTLYANGIRYLEKAPFLYWTMAASMRVFGATTWASRLPLGFAVLGLTLAMERLGRMVGGARGSVESRRGGLYAGLIVLSSFGMFIFSRINIPDGMVCLWLTVALLAYLCSEEQAQPTRMVCWGFAAACALNVLTKGLIGVVFPVGIVGLHLLAARGWRGAWARVRQFHVGSSSLVFLALAVPWHVAAGLANPGQGHPGELARVGGHWQVPYPTDGNVHGWAWFYFVNEQVYRYLNVRVPHDYDTSPLWLFYGLIAVWLMPWSAYLPGALVRALPLGVRGFRERLRRFALGGTERRNLLLVLWAGVPLLFFSLSTRQEYYVLPSLPPVILLVAALLASRALSKPEAIKHRATCARSAAAAAVLGLLAAAACVYLIVHTQAPAANTDLSALLQQNPGNYALSFGHFLDLNARAMGMFRQPLALTAIALGAGLPAAFLLRSANNFLFARRPLVHTANLVTAASAFLFLLAAHQGLAIFSPTLTSYQLARAIAPQVRAEDMVVLHGEYEAGSTLGFYLRRNDLHIVEGRSSNLWYGSFFPDAPRIFETRESIARRWGGSQRIFLWEDPHDAERSPLALPGAVYVLVDSGGKQILSNRAN